MPDAHEKVNYESAASRATRSVPIGSPADRISAVLRMLAGQRFDSAAHVVVCDGERFLGIVRIEDLLAARADQSLAELADHHAPVVAPGADQEVAAWRAVEKGESALSVVDADGRFIGLIPPDRLLAVALSEHEEDLARLGGFLHRATAARLSSVESVRRRFRHRIPWLLVGLAGALVAADLVAGFERQLERSLMLAFFIPGIVYLADAVGTQTETLVVRGLSIGVSLRQMVWRELVAGVVIGAVLALVAGPIVWWRWGDPAIALSVALALFAACSTATLLAMLLPWAIDAFGHDPAFASGPLATVIQDLLTIVIYFAIASAVLR